MKLYFTPGACSMAPHIGLREAGFTFDLEQVDLGTKKTKSGADYTKVNAKGYVPALQLDNGDVLTEAPVILQYLKSKNLNDPVVVSPDVGGLKMANAYAQALDASLAIVAKRRKSPTEVFPRTPGLMGGQSVVACKWIRWRSL